MGVPKFFRWISERYPMTSQLITPNSIPTFDNLYLDMNGIIHNCSHPPSSENDPHFRISEEQMILAIFAYIDFLFTMIKPQKVFYMAIDGCAPRAKMNQQRSRRFRTARDAREQRETAERKGEKLPDEKAFDSNCITPGTPFMARLSDHLKYYVRKRVSEDAEWRNVKVILSGHDVPGEGEHKIQDYIRASKAQPDYNPNTRHCLYGLDADLIMLGLLSHDPHFCLLREEVTFGRKAKKSTGLANQNMFLLHLSLMREYLDLEFSPVANQIPFEYDLERIIDDFILMSIFVGNDFLPHLPGLHINEGALELIWKIYKEILPAMGGYMNEHGTISLPRLQMMLDRLSIFEKDNFENEFSDVSWYKGNQAKEIAAIEKARKRGKMIITKDQQKILNQIKKFVSAHQRRPKAEDRLQFVNTLPTRDRAFIQDLADSLHLLCTWDEVDDYGQPLVTLSFNMEEIGEESEGEDEDEEWESEEDPESNIAIQRVFAKYDKAKVVDNVLEDMEESFDDMINKKMAEWKRSYYKEKLEIDWDNPESLHPLIHRYVEGLQWVVHYYYKGVSSWGWFYNYHYAPKISDIKGIADFKFDLKLGKPFRPFQQLMGVLPADSMEHVPVAYRDLMYEDTSSIIDFYPKTFALDMNGKKADWEAVVKIPFIDEERLLRAMDAREHRLTPEEKQRNSAGVPPTEFTYDDSGTETSYASSLAGFFPDLVACRCKAQPFDMPQLEDDELVLKLMDGVHLGASALAGFPSLATLPYQGTLGYHSVNVFQQDSRNQSMVITITGKHDKANTGDVAKRFIGQRTFHSWPYLHEGIVTGVSDDMFKYELQQFGNATKVISKPHDGFGAIKWKKDADKIEHHYSKRCGVIIGHVNVILHVSPLKGLKRLDTGALVKDYETADKEIAMALQTAVHQVTFEDERYLEKDAPPIASDFPTGEKVIFLGDMAYGTAAQVSATHGNALDIGIAYFPGERKENLTYTKLVMTRPSSQYTPSHALARRLGISSLALSRVTSTLMVALSTNSKTNVGLSLKFESKGLKVLGYSRKADRNWEFSDKCARLIAEYRDAFPEPFRHLDNRGGDIVTSAELCPSAEDPDQVIKDMHKWLKTRGVNDLEPVSLFAESLEKETVHQIEQLSNHFREQRSKDSIKRVQIKGIPRQAVLKPSHAIYRLQGQRFALGDRVIMVQDAAAGGVPLAMKGVVVGLGTRDIDVVWDVPFMGGETLMGRCSDYRGSTVPFCSCLNLSHPQFAIGSESAPQTVGTTQAFQPQLGPRPVVAPNNYRPSIPSHRPTQILQNPRSHPPPQRGPMQYGNAAKGIRPEAQSAPAVSHQDRLQSTLLGQAPRAHPQPPVPRQHVAKMPHIRPVSPTAIQHQLPHSNGHGAAGNGPGAPPARGAPGGRGGRGRGGGGRGAPRGRGRGRGGAAGVGAAPAAAPESAA